MLTKIKLYQWLILAFGVQATAPVLAKINFNAEYETVIYEPYKAPSKVVKQELLEDLSRLDNSIIIDETYIKSIHAEIYQQLQKDSTLLKQYKTR